jgi:hypothetical protein
LILVVREALATGAGSKLPSASSDGVGVIIGRTVDKASGSRRVRNNVEAWRYVFDMCEEDECLAEDRDEESEDIEVDRPCDDECVSVAVGLSAAVQDPLNAIVYSMRATDNSIDVVEK